MVTEELKLSEEQVTKKIPGCFFDCLPSSNSDCISGKREREKLKKQQKIHVFIGEIT